MSLGYNLETVDYPHSDKLKTEQIAAQYSGGTFLRPVIHNIPGKLRKKSDSLSDCLSAIDEHFQYLARSVGGKVVNHTWVLTKETAVRSRTGAYAHERGLELFDRPGFWLGAIVDWTPGVPAATRQGFNINIELEAHYKLRDAMVNWKKLEGWSTLSCELTNTCQYLSSAPPKEATFSTLNPVLVDIDIL